MNPDFTKLNGLIPTIIQDNSTEKVLMLGFMNEEAFNKTVQSNLVTFYSRTKNRLWTKGEESGNFLKVIQILEDCDKDTLLIKVEPAGPVCHTGNDTCFNEENKKFRSVAFLIKLQELINKRKEELPENSYTTKLFKAGLNKIIQKFGEEAVEVLIEAKDDNADLFINEVGDLLYHLLVLLSARNVDLSEITDLLESRHKPAGN